MINPTVLKKISQIAGKNNYLDSQEDRISYSYDGTPLLHSLPDAIVIPQTKEQISSILALANEEHFAVVPRGSGSGLSGGSIPVENSIVLLMSHWNKILEVDAENLTVARRTGRYHRRYPCCGRKIGFVLSA